MLTTTLKRPSLFNRRILTAAAIATITQLSSSAFAGTTPGEVTISTAGSTALKNWFTTGSFTEIEPGTTLNIGGTTYPLSGASDWAGNGGNAVLYQLAPKNNTTLPEGNVADQSAAVRLEYHESGSVEGIYELANDQIAPIGYIAQNVNRDPSTISNGLGGNAVWVNYNQFGSNSTNAWTTSAGGAANGSYLGNFYNQSGYTSSNPAVFVQNGNAQPAFNLSGGNLYGGQNAVQLALSDAIPLQVFAADSTATASTTPWTLTPQNAGYGQGNTRLNSVNLGTANARQVYQSAGLLNMSTGLVNPRTGTNFTTGPWNNGELNNLNSVTVASTATLFVANPGTGLTQINRSQAQFLETTGRLANGATFNMTTRDVNSGTRDVSSLETGIDPTWSVGENDDGNGNLNSGSGSQVTVGSGLRFSNKTAGGAELRPTVQSARMAVGTLSINDANGNAVNTAKNPVRALAFSNSMDGSTPYVAANYFTIAGINTATDPYFGTTSYNTSSNVSANPNGNQYTIFQNEQAITLKAPDASYNNSGSAYGVNSPDVQGDDSYGDVKTLMQNTLGSVKAAFNGSSGYGAFGSPVTGLMSNGYIPTQLMAVQKAQNGLSNVSASAITANPNYNVSNFTSTSQGLTAINNLVNKLKNDDPSVVTTGTGSVYGGNSLVSGGPSFNYSGSTGAIPLNSKNYLFGNFNQTGVRDYDSVVVEAQKAQAALEAAAGNNAYNVSGQLINSTPVTTGIALLDASGGVTKGDLITLGDYNGDAKFDGKDLYLMAVGASLTSTGSYRPTESGSTFSTGTMNATATTFSTSIATSVLNKNVALDYLQANATASQKAEAAQILTGTTSNVSTGIPAGSVFTGFDAVSGNVQFTYDSAGANAFNKADVNQDGVVDFNDALVVDSLNGKDYTSLNDSLTSYEPTPVTGVTQLANLVLATQSDVNSDGSAHTVVSASDLNSINSSLTGPGLTNWYGYQTTKTGPGTITWNRSGSTINLYTGASLQISSGTVHAINSGTDPFTDNNLNAPGSPTDTSKSLPVTVTTGGTLEYASGGVGIQKDRLSSLNVSGGVVVIDPSASQSNRSLLITGSLSISGTVGKLDLGNSDLIVQSGTLSTLNSLVKSGYANGTWTGNGISSSAAASNLNHLTALAVIQNSLDGSPTGAQLYGSGTSMGLFDGVSPNAADVLVKFTYYGDANLDGTVDGSDYTKVDYAFTHPGLTGWANGDFNYDGVVDGSDYTLLDNAFNTQGAALTASIFATPAAELPGSAVGTAAVPEPTSLGLLGLGIGSLLSRRRRRRA